MQNAHAPGPSTMLFLLRCGMLMKAVVDDKVDTGCQAPAASCKAAPCTEECIRALVQCEAPPHHWHDSAAHHRQRAPPARTFTATCSPL